MDDILDSKRGRSAWITLNRTEQHNCTTPEMVESMNEMISEAENDPDVILLVLTINELHSKSCGRHQGIAAFAERRKSGFRGC